MNLNLKKVLHMATAALGVVALSVAVVPNAHAGCGNTPGKRWRPQREFAVVRQVRIGP